MEITEVRIKLIDNPGDRLRGFCSVTFDGCFVVRDLKIIDGNNGPFVAMPSRKLTSNCRKCRGKNHLKANFCNQCGAKLPPERIIHDHTGRAKLYADIAHPINGSAREMIQRRIVEELEKETKLAQEPGYRSRYDEAYDSDHVVPAPHRTAREATVSSGQAHDTRGGAQSSDGGKSSSASPQQGPPPTEHESGSSFDGNAPSALGSHANSDAGKGPVSEGRSSSGDDAFGQGIF